jgi:hypothetical protein
MITVLVVAGLVLLAIAGGVFFYLRRRVKAAEAAHAVSPLPSTDRTFPAIFQAWIGIDAGDASLAPARSLAPAGENLRRPTTVGAEAQIAKHALYIHIPEAFGVFARGRIVMTAPSLVGEYEPATIPIGLDTRARLKALNPDIKLIVQIGYTEGSDATTDIPPEHPWWLRVNGVRQPGWGGSFLFNLDLPEVRQHCADCCLIAMNTGIWDGLFLDVGNNDINHVDILRRIRSKCGDWPIIMNCNYRICPNLAPLLNGFYMECGPVSGAQWGLVQAALDFNERHVIQPALNLLEISGARSNLTMMPGLLLALTRSNGFYLYSDPATHEHIWYSLYDTQLGKPIGPTRAAGTNCSQRTFEHGMAVFNPPPGASFITPV